jgi:hypothetical protein
VEIRSKMARATALAVLLTPFGLAIVGNAFGDLTCRATASPKPPLAFREYMLNLGRVPEGRPMPGRFWFANTGDRPLKILGFTPSCGCLTPQLEKLDYAPGEQGSFIVVADTAGTSVAERSGDGENLDQVKQHFVDVKYDAGDGERFERVNLKFVLPALRVTIEPRSLLVYALDGQPTEREIVVTDKRSTPIIVTKVECLNPSVGLNSEFTTGDDATRARIVVNIPAPKQGLRTAIIVHTSDPEQPRIYVPIIVQVPEKPLVRVGRSPLELVPKAPARR